jgi:hypothetical protein
MFHAKPFERYQFIVKYIRARNFLPMNPVKRNVVARLFPGAKVLVWLGRRLKTSENASLPGSLRHE